MYKTLKMLFSGAFLVAALLSFSAFTSASPAGATAHLVAGKFTLGMSPNKALAAVSVGCPGTLQEGSSGTWVQVVQYTLNWMHHNGSPPATIATDGVFGSNTKTAVEAWQKSVSLTADGIVGNQTWSSMGFCTASVPDRYDDGFSKTNFTSCPPTQSSGSSGTWVLAIQHRINTMYADGLFNLSGGALTMDGSFGPATTSGVKAYQSWDSLHNDGIVGSDTWAALDFC
jgi:peptidoglycan hydrolase-like protein with peptidoglycan-binding domain